MFALGQNFRDELVLAGQTTMLNMAEFNQCPILLWTFWRKLTSCWK